MYPECFDKCTFTHARHAGYANSDRLVGVWQAGFDNVVCLLLMFRILAFYQSNRLAEGGFIALENTVNQLQMIFFLFSELLNPFNCLFPDMLGLTDSFVFKQC